MVFLPLFFITHFNQEIHLTVQNCNIQKCLPHGNVLSCYIRFRNNFLFQVLQLSMLIFGGEII